MVILTNIMTRLNEKHFPFIILISAYTSISISIEKLTRLKKFISN